MWVGLIQSVEGPNRTNRLILFWIQENSSCLTAFKLGHRPLLLWTWTEISALPGSRACWSLVGVNTTNSPGTPAGWQSLQTLGLAGLHNHVSQFLIINLSLYTYVHIYTNIYTCKHSSKGIAWGVFVGDGMVYILFLFVVTWIYSCVKVYRNGYSPGSQFYWVLI